MCVSTGANAHGSVCFLIIFTANPVGVLQKMSCPFFAISVSLVLFVVKKSVAVHGFWKMENFQSPKMPKLLILSADLKF